MSKLKEIREAKGLTQVELAVKSGVASMTISRIERGAVTKPAYATLKVLADALGVSPEDIRNGYYAQN